MNLIKRMADIFLNGKKILTGQDNINYKQINNSIISINGQEFKCTSKIVKIEVQGDVKKVESTQGDITVHQNVTGSIKTTQGNIEVGGDIEGDLETTQGNIRVKGNVTGSCKSVMGDIRINK